MSVKIELHGDLPSFLPKSSRHLPKLEVPLTRRTSVKDFLEALGIPHPEIHSLAVNGTEKDFRHLVEDGEQITVHPLPVPVDPCRDSPLRAGVPAIRFAVDANVGKLANLLRTCGLDTFYDPSLDDSALADSSFREQRILLTRDRALLKRNNVQHGRLVRAVSPKGQLHEIIELYGIRNKVNPFSRCLLCNSLLERTDKEKIIERLEPLTRKYFEEFHICPDCDRIYWAGSHRERMLKDLEGII